MIEVGVDLKGKEINGKERKEIEGEEDTKRKRGKEMEDAA